MISKKTLKQTVSFRAAPAQVFDAFLSSRQHAAFTRHPAKISKRVGGRFSVYGGYASGKNIIISKNKKIVQSWRASNWPEGHYSEICLSLKKTKTGCQLVFTQQGIPQDDYSAIKQGWNEFYWKLLKAYLKSP